MNIICKISKASIMSIISAELSRHYTSYTYYMEIP
jgi:hypothetical protein